MLRDCKIWNVWKKQSLKMLFMHKNKIISFFATYTLIENTKITAPISQTVLLCGCCRSRYNRVSKLFVTIATFLMTNLLP